MQASPKDAREICAHNEVFLIFPGRTDVAPSVRLPREISRTGLPGLQRAVSLCPS